MKMNMRRTDSIAKERLKLMVESDPLDGASIQMMQMKKEISDIVSRYYELDPENYEINVILKQTKKRA